MAESAFEPSEGALELRAQELSNDVARTNHFDEKARFNAVVMPYLNDAYGLARWLTGNRAEAEDVVQDAFLRAFRGIGNLSDCNVRVWILTVVRHTAYQWLRKNRPATLAYADDLESFTPARSGEHDVETPKGEFIANGEATCLEDAIAALPVMRREALVLRDVLGLTYREIAEMTDVPIVTVMSRLAWARGQIIPAMLARTAPPTA